MRCVVEPAPAGAGDAERMDVLGAEDLPQHLLALDHAPQHVRLHVVGDTGAREGVQNALGRVARAGACGDGVGNFKLGEKGRVHWGLLLFKPARML